MFKPIKVSLRKARLLTGGGRRDFVCAPRQVGALGGARRGVLGRSKRILCPDRCGKDTHDSCEAFCPLSNRLSVKRIIGGRSQRLSHECVLHCSPRSENK
jgi:hypothetical protein